MRNRKAFTLFELLVVMVILSVLVGFAIPSFRLYQKYSLRVKIEGDLKLINAAMKIYYLDHKNYPAENDYLLTLLGSSPQIIDKPLYDPFSDYGSSPYPYKLTANKKYYLIYSIGALGNVRAEISDSGKVTFLNGDPAFEKWVSNGKI